MAALDVGNCFLASPNMHSENALQGLLSRLKLDQPDTHNHALAVEALSIDVAQQVSLHEPLLEELRLGALLHDVGKLEVPFRILRKQGSLTAREWATMRRHPGIGVRLLSPIIRSAEALAIVLSHHERWDGRGYPHRLVGGEIPLPARIVAVADAFHAMIELRPYRLPLTREEALSELQANAGGQFDPVCVEAACEALTSHPDSRDD
jgi:putative nucleotidyltransferase with HDIG domain